MPIYEYRCEACGRTSEALQKLADEPLTQCSACGAAALRRLISAPAFRLKGGGWYETDFKSDKEKKRNIADGSGSAAGSESSDKSKKDKDVAKDTASAKSSSDTSKTPSASKPSPSPEAA